MNLSLPSYFSTLLILPLLFCFVLVGEGVQMVVNYDQRGWLNIGIGGIFALTLLVVFFVLTPLST